MKLKKLLEHFLPRKGQAGFTPPQVTPDVRVCPVRELYQLARESDLGRAAAIAVSSYEIDRKQLAKLPRALTLHFADTPDESSPDAISPADARKIRAFVEALPERTDTLYLCCDSGESRSTAMAAALLHLFQRDEWAVWDNPHYHPNPLVYRRLLEAWGITVPEGAMKIRIERSQLALQRAIRASENASKAQLEMSDPDYDALLSAFCLHVEAGDMEEARQAYKVLCDGTDAQRCRLGLKLALGCYNISPAYRSFSLPRKRSGSRG